MVEGLTWNYYNQDWNSSFQSISVITLNPELREFDIVENGMVLKGTSRFAEDFSALAAINGSFFNIKEGGSAVLLRNENITVSQTEDPTKVTESGALAIDRKGKPTLLFRNNSSWKLKKRYKDIMSSGPALVIDGSIPSFNNNSFHNNRHPRTAIGQKEDGTWILVLVDGRNQRAEGMKITELADFMKELGCINALNLDGGGSSTMWIGGKTVNGIVNHPSDNRTFDHFGERKVANAIIIR